MAMKTLTGTVERIIFRNEENGFAIVALRLTDDRRFVVKGALAALQVGTKVECSGEEENSPYGLQMKVSTWTEVRPDDIEGIRNYLSSGLIKFIGPVLADKIIEYFGTDALDVLDNHPEKLASIPGIGKKRIKSVIASAEAQRDRRSIMIWLKRYDLPNGLASKILDTYGSQAIQALETNPYRLADEMDGVGFKKSDYVAKALGLDPESSFRIRSGLLYTLRSFTETGSTYMPKEMLARSAASDDVLGLPAELVAGELDSWCAENGRKPIYEENGCVYPTSLYFAEREVARRLLELANPKDGLFDKANEVDVDIRRVVETTGIRYNSEQMSAILTACQRDVFVLTGGPGTGKTVTTNGIICALEEAGKKVLLMAPTGRAAKRMMEATGREATTIHRGLEYGQNGFARRAEYPLDCDAVIVDECSMIDVQLMRSLLEAVADGTRVVLVGDVDQLPSVGSGCVLRDIISSGQVPTVRLTEIYRQAQDSDIIMAAHSINRGYKPRFNQKQNSDLWFLPVPETPAIAAHIVDLVARLLPEKYHYSPEQIQVLSPMRRPGDQIGTTSLNQVLQQRLNPNQGGVQFGDVTYKVGDKVMQVKNNYTKNVFNGDIGYIRDIREGETTVLDIEFNGEVLEYDKKELVEIELAYATTVHKSQGSEYPVVIMPVHKSHFILLKRNLLYTAVTRAKKLCILLGTEDAVSMAVRNEDTVRRFTGLCERLSGRSVGADVAKPDENHENEIDNGQGYGI